LLPIQVMQAKGDSGAAKCDADQSDAEQSDAEQSDTSTSSVSAPLTAAENIRPTWGCMPSAARSAKHLFRSNGPAGL